jgi:hypothetical protein
MHSPSSLSRSASPEADSTMQIFVKDLSGHSKSSHQQQESLPQHSADSLSTAITMTVPQDLAISNLTTLLSIRTSLPESTLRLVYAGKHLSSHDPSSTLTDYHIGRESTIHLAAPLRGGMPPKKIRCTHKECKEAAQRIIGDCGFCNGHFCGKHRLLEDHKCTGLEDVSPASLSSSACSASTVLSNWGEADGMPRAEPQWWLIGLDELLADMM